MGGWNGTNENIPPGCSFKVWPNGKTGRGHWNRAEKGKARANMIQICNTRDGDDGQNERSENEVDSKVAKVECSAAGDGCLESKCCADAYHKCFKKDEHWASCNASCSNKMKWVDGAWEEQDEHIWDCDELTDEGKEDTTEGKTAEDICVKDGENCMLSKCCSQEGHTCFKKDEYWASCNETCSSNYKWENGGWTDKGDEQVWLCDKLSHAAADSEKSFCDMSGCQDCEGDQCTNCREEKVRDCCLKDACDGKDGDELDTCKADNMATCCEGKSVQCTSY